MTAPVRGADGYYTLPDGTRLMSVTTIMSNGIPKPELASWSAFETARAAMTHSVRLSQITDDKVERQAIDWLVAAADRIKNKAIDNGVQVHDYIEAHLLGRPLPSLTVTGKRYIKAWENFLADENPRFVHNEIAVANLTDGWAGRVDTHMYLESRGPGLLAGDWKTSRKPRDSAAMQLSAYRRADRAWLADGTEIAAPDVRGGVVIHIRPEKYRLGYKVYDADTSDEVYQAFLAARDVVNLWTCNNTPRLTTKD